MPRLWWLVPASLTLFGACVPGQVVLPDTRVPHQLSQPVRVQVWVQTPSGPLSQQTVDVPAGWWLASPEVIDLPASPKPTAP